MATRDSWLLRQNSSMSERDHGATDGLHLGDAGGEEKRDEEVKTRKMRGLYSFKDSSWLTSSPSTGLTITYTGWNGGQDRADTTILVG